jgi:hypothetical protein
MRHIWSKLARLVNRGYMYKRGKFAFSFNLTNWTFGFYFYQTNVYNRGLIFGISFGPVELTWRF